MLKTMNDLQLKWECLDDNQDKIYNVYFLPPNGYQTCKIPIRFKDKVYLTYSRPQDSRNSFAAFGNINTLPDQCEGQFCVQLEPANKWEIKTDLSFEELKEKTGFKLEFVFNGKTVFDRMIDAVTNYQKTFNHAIQNSNNTALLIKRLILGQKVDIFQQITLDSRIFSPTKSPPLNDSQKRALLSVKNNPLTLINGPPGTGKTLLAVHIINNLHQFTNGIGLVCAGSNIAVDNILEMTGNITSNLNILRIESYHQEMYQINNKDWRVFPELSLYQKVMQRNPNLQVLYTKEDSINMDLDEKQSLQEIKWKLEQDIINESDVIFTTCVGAADRRLYDTKFDFCIIDEASQILEPETLIPMSRTNGKVVLVGNQDSLEPVVYSDEAAQQGLNVSMFQRLIKMKRMDKFAQENGISLVKLNTQYRMHPAISNIYSHLNFIKLVNGMDSKDRITTVFPWPVQDDPVVFIPCSKGKEIDVGVSYSNREEASLVVKVAQKLIDNGLGIEDIGVIACFDGQRSLLKRSLIKEYKIPEGIEVNSVDGFLGREKEIIIMTCVRSESFEGKGDFISFLKDERRLNAAITRARRGLIIIGNPVLLRTKSMWKKLLMRCKEYNFDAETF